MFWLLILLSVLWRCAVSQVPELVSCFDPFKLKETILLARGDKFELDLGSESAGDNLRYSAEIEGPSGQLLKAPSVIDHMQELIDMTSQSPFNLTNCQQYSQPYENTGILYLLCDYRQIVAIDIRLGKNMISVKRSANIPSEISSIARCTDMKLNPVTNMLDVVCWSPGNSSIYLVQYDQLLTNYVTWREFPQEKTSTNSLKGNLSMFYLTDAGVAKKEVVIILHESLQNRSRLLLKCIHRDTQNTSLFNTWTISPQLGNLINLNAESSHYLYAISRYDAENFALMVGGESQASFYLAKFLLASQTITCEKTSLAYVVLPSDQKPPKFHLIPNSEVSEMYIYLLAQTSIASGTLRIQKTIGTRIDWHDDPSLVLDSSAPQFVHIDEVYQLSDQTVFLGKSDLSVAGKHDMGFIVHKDNPRRTFFKWPNSTGGFGVILPQTQLQYSHVLVRTTEEKFISFSRLDNPELDWSSEGYPSELDPQFSIKLTCTPGTNSKLLPATQSVAVRVFQSISESYEMKLYSMKFYFGTNMIQLPVNGNRISGNAPIIKGVDSNAPVIVQVESIFKRVIEFDELESVKYAEQFLGVGDQFILMWNSSVLKLAECDHSSSSVNIQCFVHKVPLLEDKVKQLNVIDALMFKDYLVVAVSLPKYLLILRIREENPSDFVILKWQQYVDFGKLKVNEDFLDLFFVGSNWETPTFRNFYLLEIENTFNQTLADLRDIFSFGSQICPLAMAIIPRTKTEFDFLSYCKGDLNSFSHRYLYNPDNKQKSRFVVASDFPPLTVGKVQLCSTNSAMVLVDLENHQVSAQSVDPDQTSYTYMAPLDEYGMDTIVSAACDYKKRLLQVIASNSTTKQKKLILYRPDEFFNPFRRVHSVNDIQSWAVYTALIDSGIDDQLTSMVVCTNRNNMNFYNILTDGPQMTLDLSKVKQEGNYTISYNVTLPGRNSTSHIESHTLELVQYKPDFTATLVSVLQTKQKVVDGMTLDLEKLVNFKGVFFGVQSSDTSAYEVTDRFLQTYYHHPVTKKYRISCARDGLVFGFYLVDEQIPSAGVTVELINLQKGSVISSFEGAQIISLKCLAKLDTQTGIRKPFFFAMMADGLGNNYVKVVHVFNKDVTGVPNLHPSTIPTEWPVSAWRQSGFPLNLDGVIKAVFEVCDGPHFTLITFSSKYGYQLGMATLTFNEERLETYYIPGDSHTTKEAVSYIDNVALGTNVVMFYTEQKNLSLVVRYYEMDELTMRLVFVKADSISLEADNKFLFGLNHIFECILWDSIDTSALIKCVFIDQGTESHQVDLYLYTGKNTAQRLIEKGRLGFSLSNLPDFQPYCVDFHKSLISVVGHSTVESDANRKHMVIIFKIDHVMEPEELVEPHKIFQSSLVESTKTPIFSGSSNFAEGIRLSASIFKSDQNLTTLHINDPSQEISYKHYRPSNLTLRIKKISKLADDSVLVFRLPGEKLQSLQLSQFIDIQESLNDWAALNQKRKYVFVACLVGIVIIIVLICVHYFAREKSSSREVLEAMFDNTSQIGEVTAYPSIYERD